MDQNEEEKSSQAKELFKKAVVYEQKDEYDNAIEAYSAIISIDPSSAAAYLGRGRTYTSMQEYDKALKDLNRTISIDPNCKNAYYIRGLIHNQNSHDMAVEDYSKAIEIDPNLYYVYYARGFSYGQLGRYEEAIDDYSKVISLEPKEVDAYKGRATAYFSTGQFHKTVEDYSNAISINPSDRESYVMRANACNAMGQYEKSIEDCNKAITMDPNNIDAFTSRGIAYYLSGDRKRARPDLSKACDMGDKGACAVLKEMDDAEKKSTRLIALRDIEPFNVPPVDDHEAALFTRHLTGHETFEFESERRPLSMLIYSLKYNYPRHSFANAWLLSVDVDTFLNICNSGKYPNMEPILKNYVIGSIDIEYGGNLTGTGTLAKTVKL